MDEFTIMSPIHSAEEAYMEWVIKAVEIVSSNIFEDEDIKKTESRQFGILLNSNQNFRKWCEKKWTKFFQKKYVFLISGSSNRWMFWFDSPRDVVPTARRSDRRDQSLSRRLATTLRALLCLQRVLPKDTSVEFELLDNGFRFSNEITTISSSFGTLNLALEEKNITEDDFFSRTNSFPSPLEIDETFVAQTTRATARVSLPRVHSGSSIVHVGSGGSSMVFGSSPMSARIMSPPRDVSDIWPTSNLSYSSGSPGGSLGDDEISIKRNIFPLPKWDNLAQDEQTEPIFPPSIFEIPIPVSILSEQLERISRYFFLKRFSIITDFNETGIYKGIRF